MQEYDDIEIATSTQVSWNILRTLAYAEVFSYPLTIEEIISALEIESPDLEEIEKELQILIEKEVVFNLSGYYSLSPNFNRVNIRQEKNQRAVKYKRYARFISRFIGNFPFVRAVFLSGSLSKNSMEHDSDIDYFVITEPGKLWLARTFLMAFKKIFLFNSYKFFCINYFIDSNNMKIEDRNLYVAHEIATLIPTYGKSYGLQFIRSNNWVTNFLPNSAPNNFENVPEHRLRGLKWVMEVCLNNNIGRYFDGRFKNISRKYWKMKFKQTDERELKHISISEDYMSTHHPENFKTVILQRQVEILSEIKKNQRISLK